MFFTVSAPFYYDMQYRAYIINTGLGLMKKRYVYLFAFALATSSTFSSAGNRHLDYDGQVIDYNLDFNFWSDSESASSLGIFIHNNAIYGYENNVEPHLSTPVKYMVGIPFNIALTHFALIYPHEIGHGIRAREYGGDFIVHEWAFPVPVGERINGPHTKPEYFTPEENLLFSIGGFEVNTHASLRMQKRYYLEDDMYTREVVLYTLNKLMAPFYFYGLANFDPNDPNIWLNYEGGDPGEMSGYLFEMQTGGAPMVNAGIVDPRLIAIYSQMKEATLWALLDPTVIQAFVNSGENAGTIGDRSARRVRPWMLGTHNFKWMYGTQVNFSTLGVEKYLHHFIKASDEHFVLYTKTGAPFKNNGFGVQWQNAFEAFNYRVGLSYDSWDQDYYGSGNAYSVDFSYWPTKGLGLTGRIGSKDKGYLIGKSTSATEYAELGFQYHYNK